MMNQIDFLNNFNSINNNHENDEIKRQIKLATSILLNKIKPNSDIEEDINTTVAVNNLVNSIVTLDAGININFNSLGDNDLYD